MSRMTSQISDNLLDALDAPALSDTNGSQPPEGAGLTPPVPRTVADTGVDADLLRNLVLKLAYTVPGFTSDWASKKLRLPLRLTGELLEHLRREQSLDMLGEVAPFNYRFTITGRGRERAQRVMEISRYIGPAPVSLEAYTRFLAQQFGGLPNPTHDQVVAAINEMVLPESTIELAGLAALSRRSLFLYGPPGNGKTTLGHLLHDVALGHLWIPHCIAVDHSVIKVFDHECHEEIDLEDHESPVRIDQRWIKIKRPFVAVGGELAIDALDLIYTESLGHYEAPLHFKANGGTFLLDDFGCQRVAPEKLLNRWIHPLERGIDFLTLRTGQQLAVPFQQMLVVSTNLNPDEVMTPAFLRRMGYRVYLANPSPEEYSSIFRRYAEACGAELAPAVMDQVLQWYQADKRPLHSCEPRDLIQRVRDICEYYGRDFELTEESLQLAWKGYFGQEAEQE